MDDEDSNGLPLSSSILGLSSTEDDSPLVQCTAELRALEAMLVSGNWPFNKPDLVNAVRNLTRLKVALEVDDRLVEWLSAEARNCTEYTCNFSSRAMPGDTGVPKGNVTSKYHLLLSCPLVHTD